LGCGFDGQLDVIEEQPVQDRGRLDVVVSADHVDDRVEAWTSNEEVVTLALLLFAGRSLFTFACLTRGCFFALPLLTLGTV